MNTSCKECETCQQMLQALRLAKEMLGGGEVANVGLEEAETQIGQAIQAAEEGKCKPKEPECELCGGRGRVATVSGPGGGRYSAQTMLVPCPNGCKTKE